MSVETRREFKQRQRARARVMRNFASLMYEERKSLPSEAMEHLADAERALYRLSEEISVKKWGR